MADEQINFNDITKGYLDVLNETRSAIKEIPSNENIGALQNNLNTIEKHIDRITEKYENFNKTYEKSGALKATKIIDDLNSKHLDSVKDIYNTMYNYETEYQRQKTQYEAKYYTQKIKYLETGSKEEYKKLKILEEEYKKSDLRKYERGKRAIESLGNAAKTTIRELFKFLNNLTDIYFFNNVEKGIRGFRDAYEQNFSSIAGYTGVSDRKNTHNLITSTLGNVNANEYTKAGLNFNEEVFPKIAEAVKNGFLGDEAQEIAISNAIDAKIMPWLDTNSETWTQLQYDLSNSSLQQIKGQQLQLQATREGNRILQSGVADTIINSLLPSLDNIYASNTDISDLNEKMQAKAAYYMSNGVSKTEAIKAINKEIEAYQNPLNALQNGDLGSKLLALDNLNGTSLYENFAGSFADNWVSSGVAAQNGIPSFGETRTNRGTSLAAGWTDEEEQRWIKKLQLGKLPEEYQNLYENKKSNLPEYVTATKAYDNAQQNEYAEKYADNNLQAHRADVTLEIYNEVKSIKDWLIRDMIPSFFIYSKIDKLVDKGIEKFGSKLFGKNIPGTGAPNPSNIGDLPTGGGASNLGGSPVEGSWWSRNFGSSGKTATFNSSKLGMTLNGATVAGGMALAYNAFSDANEDYKFAADTNNIKSDREKAESSGFSNTAIGAAGGAAAVGGALGLAGGAAGAGSALAAVGAVAGPLGWLALALGGAAYGIKKYNDYVDKLNDATENLTKGFVDTKKNIDEESKSRKQQLISMREELYETDNVNEVIKELHSIGLNPQIDKTKDVNKQLTVFIDKLIESNNEMSKDSKNIADDIAGEYKNVYNQNADTIKQSILDNYNADAIRDRLIKQGKSATDEDVWQVQHDYMVDAGYSEEVMEAARTHFLNGPMGYSEFRDFLWSGAIDGDNTLSFDQMVGTGKISIGDVNQMLESVGYEGPRLMDSEDISTALGKDVLMGLSYLRKYKEFGRNENKIKNNVPEEFSQQMYDEYKKIILSMPKTKTNKEILTQAFYAIGENGSTVMSDWPNSLKGFKLGSSFIAQDMVAQLHKGERVLTDTENEEYTKNQLSGNNAVSVIQTGVTDIVSAIQQQTNDILNALLNKMPITNTNNTSAFSLLPAMGNTRVLY